MASRRGPSACSSCPNNPDGFHSRGVCITARFPATSGSTAPRVPSTGGQFRSRRKPCHHTPHQARSIPESTGRYTTEPKQGFILAAALLETQIRIRWFQRVQPTTWFKPLSHYVAKPPLVTGPSGMSSSVPQREPNSGHDDACSTNSLVLP